MARIKCGVCKDYHESVQQVRTCSGKTGLERTLQTESNTTNEMILEDIMTNIINVTPAVEATANDFKGVKPEIVKPSFVPAKSFEASVHTVTVSEVVVLKNSAGNPFIKFTLRSDDTKRPIWTEIHLAGKSFEAIDLLACKVTGRRLTETPVRKGSAKIKGDDLSYWVKFVESLTNKTFTAWIREDTLPSGKTRLTTSIKTWRRA